MSLIKKSSVNIHNYWRKDRDSNPGYVKTHNGFRDRPDRPLRHLSLGFLIANTKLMLLIDSNKFFHSFFYFLG